MTLGFYNLQAQLKGAERADAYTTVSSGISAIQEYDVLNKSISANTL